MTRTVRIASMCILSVSLARVSAAQDADTILADAERRHRSLSQEYAGEIVVTSRSGTERRRQWRSYREGSGATANRLIRFIGPPEVRGVALLSRGRPSGQPDQWMYLPSMKRERRIAAQDRESSFVGTDFNYEDLDELDRRDYQARRLADETVDGVACYAIELVPRTRSVYRRKTIVLRIDTLVPVRLDGFRAADTAPSKRLQFGNYAEVDGHWVARRLEMADALKGSRTLLLLSDVHFDRPQPPDRFTVQNLVREVVEADVAPGRGSAPRRMSAPSSSAFGPIRQPPASREARAPRPFFAFGAPTGSFDAKVVALPTTRTPADTRTVSSGRLIVRQSMTAGRVTLAGAVLAEKITANQQGALAWDPADRLPLRSPLSLREASLSAPVAPAFDVTVGRFTPAWGRTEHYSPQDAFLPRDATDPLDAEKLPLWGARLAGDRGSFRFEAYHAFVTTPWRLPRMDGRYSPFGGLDIFLNRAGDPPPRRGFSMMRVTRSGRAWDFGGWVREGIRPAPLLSGDLDEARTDGDLRLVETTRRFTTERAGGLEIGRLAGPWLLRGEAAVLSSPDPDLGTSTILVFEAELPAGDATFVAMIAGSVPRPPISSLLVFDRASLPAALVGWTERTPWGSWKVSWLATIETVGGLLRAEVVDHLTDRWTLTIGADLPHGARLSPLGAFAAARRVHGGLKLSW